MWARTLDRCAPPRLTDTSLNPHLIRLSLWAKPPPLATRLGTLESDSRESPLFPIPSSVPVRIGGSEVRPGRIPVLLRSCHRDGLLFQLLGSVRGFRGGVSSEGEEPSPGSRTFRLEVVLRSGGLRVTDPDEVW